MRINPISRRRFMAAGAAATAMVASPGVLRAQTKEIFVGGPASPGLQDVLFPVIEKKHGFKVLFEGTNSLINLQKIQANKDRPTMTVTMMDDPVLILAEREKLIEKLPADVTNLADVLADAKPRGGMWANWCQPMCSASHNTKSLPNGLASYADAWDKKYKEKIVMISMRITQAIAPLVAAASLATGKPLGQSMKEWQAGFEKLKELKPNILQVSAQGPQLQQLLESGEVDLYLSPDFAHDAVPQGARRADRPDLSEGRRVRDAGRRRAGERRAEPGSRHQVHQRDARARHAGADREDLLSRSRPMPRPCWRTA